MQIKHLNLVNFRNYESVDIAFQPGVNLLLGGNGQGKTSIVEAIIYCSSLVGPRYGGYQSMIKLGNEKALVRALARYLDKEFLVELELNHTDKNRAKVNKGDVPTPRSVLGYVKTIHFTPEDSRIVHDDPQDRRDFIDQLIIQLSPRFAAIFSDYERALKQRNSLLKNIRTLSSASMIETLEAWNQSLIGFGSQIIAKRYDVATKLSPYLEAAYKKISGDQRLATISSVSSIFSSESENSTDYAAVTTADEKIIAELFSRQLAHLQPRELERGYTLVGPHRDELKLMLGEYPAKGFISYGEAWLFAVSLKLASAELLRAESQSGDPVLILDDVFSSLDDDRLQRLMDLISGYEQVIITDAIRGKLPVFENITRFEIFDGKVRQLDG